MNGKCVEGSGRDLFLPSFNLLETTTGRYGKSQQRNLVICPNRTRFLVMTRGNFISGYYYLLVLIFFLLALQPPLGIVFYSPLAGFSLLAYEVS